MSSIRWIRNVLIGGKESTLEIMEGTDHIGDKCYVRVNLEAEIYFRPVSRDRDTIITHGVGILKEHLKDQEVTLPDGTPYLWN